MSRDSSHPFSAVFQSRAGNYFELTKPRLTFTSTLTAAWGFVLGSTAGVDFLRLSIVLMASFLVGAGANALNEYLERDVDARMARTQARPLPTGRTSERGALYFGMFLSISGVTWLWIGLNPLAALFGATILLGYLLVYTPLKRITPLNTFVGAVPGALPVLLGWAATGSKLGLEAGILFLILFLWQLPHFFAIAWAYREDYLKGGLRMFGAGEGSGPRMAVAILFWSLLLVLSSVAPYALKMTGGFYLAAASAAGIYLVVSAVGLLGRIAPATRKFVGASIVYLLVLMLFMVLDKRQ
jgi:protoheme IX farnesyltransferase